MKSENYIYTLRKKLGLTSKELAALIDCERGTLSMVESGKRRLPTKSNLLLRNLELSLEEAEKTYLDFEVNDEELKQKCAKHLKATQLKRSKLELLLETCIEKADKLALFSKIISLFETTDLTGYSEIVQLEMKIVLSKALRELRGLNLKIAIYKIRIAGLSAEITEAEKFI